MCILKWKGSRENSGENIKNVQPVADMISMAERDQHGSEYRGDVDIVHKLEFSQPGMWCALTAI